MIRFIFVAATVILFLILSIPLMLVEFLIGRKTAACAMYRAWP